MPTLLDQYWPAERPNARSVGPGVLIWSKSGENAGTIEYSDGDEWSEITPEVDLTGYATLAGAETLDNKTLTAPIIATISNTGTLTLPTATDTLVARATTDTLTNKAFGNQTTFAAGTAGAPSIAKTGDPDTGLNLLETANVVQLVSGGVAALVANADSASSLVTLDRDGNVDASLLSLTHSNGAGGVASAKPSLTVSRYTSAGGNAVFGAAYASAGTGGTVVGGEFLGQAGSGWTPGADGLVIGMKSDANAYRSDVKCYGANVFAWAVDANATNATLVGIEVDLGGRTGSTVATRYGVQVVSPDLATVQASGEDVAYRVAAKSLAATFKTGLLIDHNGGKWPIDATGTLFDARTGTVANGIDFSTMTFTGHALKLPNLVVNGAGRLAVRTTAADGSTPLRMNADGDSFLMVVDNAAGILAAGAGAGADRYLKIKIGTETVVFAGKVQ